MEQVTNNDVSAGFRMALKELNVRRHRHVIERPVITVKVGDSVHLSRCTKIKADTQQCPTIHTVTLEALKADIRRLQLF